MTQEEKAKAYDEALKKARQLCGYPTTKPFISDLQDLFPELKENDDVRIRKGIESIIKHYRDEGEVVCPYPFVTIEETLAWLEKQGEPVEINPTEFDTRLQALIGKFDSLPKEELIGSLSFWMNVVQNDGTYKDEEKQVEQKPTFEMITPEESLGIDSETYNKIVDECIYGEQKPIIDGILTATNYDKMFQNCKVHKFNVGDWIVFNGLTLLVNEVAQGYYRTISIGGISNSYDWDIDNLARLWTIQDAKDGDVLAIDPWSDYPSSFVAIYKKQNGEDFDSYCFVGFDGKFYKGENGHSTEKIHPATKEQRDLLFQKMHEAGYEWDFEKKELKKTAWCEEDEGYMDRILEALYDYYPKRYAQSICDWLKFFKKNMKGE